MDSRYSRFGKNTILIVIGNIGSKFMAFLMLPFYTRWMPVDEYGEVDVINIYVSFLIGIVTCAIAESVFVFPKGQKHEKQSAYFSSGVHFLLIVYIVLLFAFFLTDQTNIHLSISNTFFNNTWLIYGILVTSSFQQYVQQFTRSIDKIYTYSSSGLIQTITSIAFSFLLIPSYGVFGYCIALMLANIIAASYSMIFSKSYQYYSYPLADMASCKEMLNYSTPLVPNNVMWWIISALNRPVMETCLGLKAIGLFAVANKLPSVVSSLFAMFAVSWQISVMEEFGKEGYSHFFNKVFRWVVLLMVMAGCVISLFSHIIIEVFADHKYIDSWRYVPVLTLSTVFLAISGFTGSNFSATKESKYFFYSSAWGALTAVAVNFILIPIFGTMGACLSVVFAFVAMSFSRCIYCWKYVKLINLYRIVFTVLVNIIFIIIVLQPFPFLWKCFLLVLGFFVLFICNSDIINDILKLLKR